MADSLFANLSYSDTVYLAKRLDARITKQIVNLVMPDVYNGVKVKVIAPDSNMSIVSFLAPLMDDNREYYYSREPG